MSSSYGNVSDMMEEDNQYVGVGPSMPHHQDPNFQPSSQGTRLYSPSIEYDTRGPSCNLAHYKKTVSQKEKEILDALEGRRKPPKKDLNYRNSVNMGGPVLGISQGRGTSKGNVGMRSVQGVAHYTPHHPIKQGNPPPPQGLPPNLALYNLQLQANLLSRQPSLHNLPLYSLQDLMMMQMQGMMPGNYPPGQTPPDIQSLLNQQCRPLNQQHPSYNGAVNPSSAQGSRATRQPHISANVRHDVQPPYPPTSHAGAYAYKSGGISSQPGQKAVSLSAQSVPARGSLPVPDRKTENSKEVKVVIDAANVMEFGKSPGRGDYDARYLQAAIKYFESRGVRVVGLIPLSFVEQKDGSRGNVLGMRDHVVLLHRLIREGRLMVTPPGCLDDEFIIDMAKGKDAYIVSLDMFRDHIKRSRASGRKGLGEFIEGKRIPYSIFEGEFYAKPSHPFIEMLNSAGSQHF